MPLSFRPLRAALLCLLVAAGVCAAVAAPAPDTRPLGVCPLLVDAAAQVWGVVARPDNPVWPGWNASDTPLLLYLPGRQELLIGHPSPPPGFVRYTGPLEFPGAPILVRQDSTLFTADGQNTSTDLNGVRTLVVADPLSNIRQNIAALLADPRPAEDKVRGLELAELSPDPYDQLGLIVHEAFHVYQDRTQSQRDLNEGLLLTYPVLAVDNNVGFGLEAGALADAIAAADPAALRAAAVRWLAAREQRRRALPARAIAYEDGIEFTEGLAKYTEYRLWQVLEGQRPVPGLDRAQGFAGFADLSPQRRRLLAAMRRHLRGEVNVNNAPYGTAPLRMRLYYSGMAMGVLLDRVAPGWKPRLWASDSSLSDLLRLALAATPAELAQGWERARADTAYAPLLAAKTRLAADGARDAAARLAAFGSGPGVRLVIEYGGLGTNRVGLAFTPFGITRVDTARVIFDQTPIRAVFSDGSQLSETFARPVLRDTLARELHVRLPRDVPRAELVRLAGGRLPEGTPAPLELELPDVQLSLQRATVRLAKGEIRVRLWPAEPPRPGGGS